MTGNEEFIQDFLVECEENLDQLDQDLVALEEDPRNPDRLASIFRTIHTIKGTSGFFGFSKLGAVAHAGEGLLSRLRAGEIILHAQITTELLHLVDAVRTILSSIESDGHEGPVDYGPLAARLTELTKAPAVEAVPTESEGTSDSDATVAEPDEVEPVESETASVPAAETKSDPTSEVPGPAAEPIAVADSGQEAGASDVAITRPNEGGEKAADESREESGAEAQLAGEHEADEGKSTSAASVTASDASVRVDVSLLDQLMNLVGELVLARNQLRPFGDVVQNRVFSNATQQLDHITTELQEGIMKTRMQPIDRLWSKFPRIVRDLAQTKGKQVHLEMQGRETELDRTLLDAIKDPLTHLIRNAVDHGIEPPAERRESGKPELGHVLLSAFHEGGVVNIEIADDGGGIDPERVKEKALRLGLISRDQAREMSDRQLMQLIFLPGLSTAERVTDISGRGVGMDVVKTNIDKIGGTIAIQSRIGLGTTLRIQIPLTLAIIPALIVMSEKERFAIPQVSLREIITLYDSGSVNGIEMVGDAQVYRLRGELLPLIELHKLLRLPERMVRTGEEFAHVVVLQAANQRFGLVVDNISNTEEIVVKPLHKALAPLRLFSGATIMDDGRVALILDVVGLARSANVLGVTQQQAAKPETISEEMETSDAAPIEPDEFLVCEASPGHHLAIPLNEVARLEEVPRAAIDSTNGQDVIPYRGHLMPLLTLDAFDVKSETKLDMIATVVHAVGDRHIGIMVNRILDVSTASQEVDTTQKRAGVLGRALINRHVIEVVDVHELARATGIVCTTNADRGALV